MPVNDFFEFTVRRSALIVTPLRNISSLAEADVKANWDQIIEQLADEDVAHVVFDVAAIEYFGSSMLEALLALWKNIIKSGGRLAICNASPVVREILRISRFESVWPICDSVDAALDEVNLPAQTHGC